MRNALTKPRPLGGIKTTAPPLRENNVARKGCLNRLNTVQNRSVILIVAPGGSGKSTLLRQIFQYKDEKNETCLWLSLDKADRNIDHFLQTLFSCFELLPVPLTYSALDFANPSRLDDLRDCAEQLADACINFGGRINLHIDECHLLDKTEGGELLNFLIEMQPSNLSIILAARSQPELPLSRLKVENRLLEFTWRDLAFNETEAVEFFSNQHDLALSDQSIRHIHKQTEGWAAGIQLAYLKARIDHYEPEADLRHPTLLHNAAAYFKSEIFSSLPLETRTFLLRTSVLDKMNDELAGHVAGVSAREASELFKNLYDHGFFITQLDIQHGWKRYHYLFQDILREMQLSDAPDAARELEKAASRWFEKKGFIHEAIEYAVRSEDFEYAVELVEAHTLALFSEGAAAELASWIRKVPDSLIVRRPQLPLYICFLYAHSHQPVEAMRRQYEYSKHIVSTLHGIGNFDNESEYRQLLNELDAVATIIEFRSGDMRRTITMAERILNAKLPIRELFATALYNTLGYARFAVGDNDGARKALTHARDGRLNGKSVLGFVFAECFFGLVDYNEGKLSNALALFESAHDYAIAELGPNSLPAAIANLYLIVFYYEQDALTLPSSSIHETLELCKDCCEPEIYAKVLTILYAVYLKEGDLESAQKTAEATASYAKKTGHSLIYLQVRHVEFINLLNAGKVSAAMDLFSQLQPLLMTENVRQSDVADRIAYWRDLFRVEIMLCAAQPKKAADLLDSLLSDAVKYKRVRRQILIIAKKAIALSSAGRYDDALNCMRTALQKAKSTGFFRTILDIGPAAIELVRQCRQIEDDPEMTVYIDRFVERAESGISANAAPINTLVLQELTNRELDILKQLIAGSKNREICGALQLSENTVKWYLKRVYEKLGARNRTEAAMMAKTLFAAL